MAFEVRKLAPEDDRSQFHSGNEDLERFFARYAGQNQFRHHIGTTYVAVDPAGVIAGFATVSASEIARNAIPAVRRKRLPKYPVPVVRVARLAVSEGHKGQGIGSLLLRSVFVLAARMAGDMACVGLVVDAKPDAIKFYEKLGFMALEVVAGELGDRPLPVPMFLELDRLANS